MVTQTFLMFNIPSTRLTENNLTPANFPAIRKMEESPNPDNFLVVLSQLSVLFGSVN